MLDLTVNRWRGRHTGRFLPTPSAASTLVLLWGAACYWLRRAASVLFPLVVLVGILFGGAY